MGSGTLGIVRLTVGVEEVAEMLGVSSRHVRRLVDSGRMPPPARLGRLLKWDKAAIETWAREGFRPVRGKGAA